MTTISGGITANFQYDAAGRRLAKTIAGNTTQFFYDGINIIQELNASNVATANLLTGLSIDEVYSRTDTGGTQGFLTDALDSTIALTDATGAVAASYTYEPYGKSTKTDTTSNTQTYTGREDDGTGLYYYRARYYHPGLSCFISKDPLGIAAGPNVYSYVGGNPIGIRDPLGLDGFMDPGTLMSGPVNANNINGGNYDHGTQQLGNIITQGALGASAIGGAAVGIAVAPEVAVGLSTPAGRRIAMEIVKATIEWYGNSPDISTQTPPSMDPQSQVERARNTPPRPKPPATIPRGPQCR